MFVVMFIFINKILSYIKTNVNMLYIIYKHFIKNKYQPLQYKPCFCIQLQYNKYSGSTKIVRPFVTINILCFLA